MAQPQPQPRLLSRSELRRIQDCASENTKLADCWRSDQVAIVACEPTGAHISGTSVIFLDVLSPAANPLAGSKTAEWHPTRRISEKAIRMLEWTRGNERDLPPRPWNGYHDCLEESSLYRDAAVARARGVFSALRAQYASVCVASHDLRDSLASLAAFGVELPAGAVLVDLVKVLEHQCRLSGAGAPPEELRRYTDLNVTVRNGRYERRPWPVQGPWGMPNTGLLRVLGPAAERHRRDKTEKRDAAMKRIVRRMAVGEIPVRNKGRS